MICTKQLMEEKGLYYTALLFQQVAILRTMPVIGFNVNSTILNRVEEETRELILSPLVAILTEELEKELNHEIQISGDVNRLFVTFKDCDALICMYISDMNSLYFDVHLEGKDATDKLGIDFINAVDKLRLNCHMYDLDESLFSAINKTEQWQKEIRDSDPDFAKFVDENFQDYDYDTDGGYVDQNDIGVSYYG